MYLILRNSNFFLKRPKYWTGARIWKPTKKLPQFDVSRFFSGPESENLNFNSILAGLNINKIPWNLDHNHMGYSIQGKYRKSITRVEVAHGFLNYYLNSTEGVQMEKLTNNYKKMFLSFKNKLLLQTFLYGKKIMNKIRIF